MLVLDTNHASEPTFRTAAGLRLLGRIDQSSEVCRRHPHPAREMFLRNGVVSEDDD